MINYQSLKIFFPIITYLLGSINFSIILLKFFGKKDPRKYGSKNPGATNVYRQAGIKIAITVLLLDIIRAYLIGIVAKLLIRDEYILVICFCLILGNCLPCFHNFKGGKGIANYLGFTISITPLFSLFGISIWCLLILVFNKPFIASLGMVTSLAIGTLLTVENNYPNIIGIFFSIIIIIKSHKKNIVNFKNLRKIK